MHALSYACRVAAVLDDPNAYHWFAEWIWQGDVGRVIRETTEIGKLFPTRS